MLTPSPVPGIPLLFLLAVAPHLFLLFSLGLSWRLMNVKGAEDDNSLLVFGMYASMCFLYWKIFGGYYCETFSTERPMLIFCALMSLWAFGSILFFCVVEKRVWDSVQARCAINGCEPAREFLFTNFTFAIFLAVMFAIMFLGMKFLGILWSIFCFSIGVSS